ncbi:hypothetical protein PSR1_03321 [Anaeromyxobacter sp. PSR-1]|nr:hypothetical protein PSR1_03321 [Anaeromyxobacter sp. PSR-1]
MRKSSSEVRPASNVRFARSYDCCTVCSVCSASATCDCSAREARYWTATSETSARCALRCASSVARYCSSAWLRRLRTRPNRSISNAVIPTPAEKTFPTDGSPVKLRSLAVRERLPLPLAPTVGSR